jgi:FKBP-type peptidyl-prolyl cis-trans isomerase
MASSLRATMFKKFTILSGLAAASITYASAQDTKPAAKEAPAAGKEPAAAPAKGDAASDKNSYALGHRIGNDISRSFKQQGIEIDANAFAAGLKDALGGGAAKYSEEEMEKIMAEFEEAQRAKMQEKMEAAQEEELKNDPELAKQVDINRAKEKAFLDQNGKKEGVTTTASGLQYEVLKKGEGAKPKATDTVKVHYHGTLLDGTVFDSSVTRGEPAQFGVKQVIKGWTEALQLMPVGSKYKLVIPAKLAYGNRAMGDKITPASTLVFEVELLEILGK